MIHCIPISSFCWHKIKLFGDIPCQWKRSNSYTFETPLPNYKGWSPHTFVCIIHILDKLFWILLRAARSKSKRFQIAKKKLEHKKLMRNSVVLMLKVYIYVCGHAIDLWRFRNGKAQNFSKSPMIFIHLLAGLVVAMSLIWFIFRFVHDCLGVVMYNSQARISARIHIHFSLSLCKC